MNDCYPDEFIESFLYEVGFVSHKFQEWMRFKNISLYAKNTAYEYLDGEEGDTWKYEYYFDSSFTLLAGYETNFGGDEFEYNYTKEFVEFMKKYLHEFINEDSFFKDVIQEKQ